VLVLQQVLQAPLPQSPVLPWLDAAWARIWSLPTGHLRANWPAERLNIAFNWAHEALAKQRSSVPAGCAMARAVRIALGTPIPLALRTLSSGTKHSSC